MVVLTKATSRADQVATCCNNAVGSVGGNPEADRKGKKLAGMCGGDMGRLQAG